MDLEQQVELVNKPPTEELINERELRQLLQTKSHPEHYIGFEISGQLHLGTLIVCGNKVNDLAQAGVNVKIYLADWHSYINNKLDGNWENILQASQYYREAFKFYCPKAQIIIGTELYHHNDDYWRDVVRFSKRITLARNTRCLTIMGRSEKDKLDFAQYLYPPMQGVDVKYIGQDLPHGGMDQRKIHVLCREVFPKLSWKKPVLLHHHLLMGLAKPVEATSADKLDQVIASKMSKSKPWTAIFIHDSEEEINAKLNKAWCPERSADMNPLLEIAKYVIFPKNSSLTIRRPKQYGGTEEFTDYVTLERAYIAGHIHPKDLKANIAHAVNDALEPIRTHFEKKANIKLLNVYKTANITR